MVRPNRRSFLYIGEPTPSTVVSTGFAVLRAGQDLDPRFLYYLVTNQAFTDYLVAHEQGSAYPAINVDVLSQAEVMIPEYPEQRAIAHVLGTLDDKIELNRQMNETLEAMARALFKSWFVDFDPVHAKAEGRDPGLPAGIAALFPNSFEDSELGEIPRGWEVRRVGDVGSIICGKTPSTQIAEYYGDDVPFITIPDMHGRVFATHTQKRLSHAGAASQQKKMLPPHAICVSCIATPGLVVITSAAAQTNQQINTVVPSDPNENYYWFWSLRDLGEEIRSGASSGSVVSNLSTGRFSDLHILSPGTQLRSWYHSLVAPLFSRILKNAKESDTLAILRDTLLPRFLSGDLRLKNSRQQEEALR
jgi:type I restriction enzyme S subunit